VSAAPLALAPFPPLFPPLPPFDFAQGRLWANEFHPLRGLGSRQRLGQEPSFQRQHKEKNLKYGFVMHPCSAFARKMMRRGVPRNFRKLAAMAILLASVLACAGLARAQTLSGTVTNATTGKPAAGDDVVLLSLAQGMQESGRTKTDAQGNFSFNLPEVGPHLVRVNHQGVNYFPAGGPIVPGVSTTTVKVYDVAKKLDGVGEAVRVVRVQAAGPNSLQIIELISIKNSSSPPRSLMADRTYEITLPEGAQVDSGVAQAPGGMPVSNAPVPDDKVKGKYYFIFPLRPGETRFEIAYHLPYSGEATLKPKVTGRLEHFAVMLPKSMEFGAKVQGLFSPVTDDPQSNLQVTAQVTPDKDLSFRISGTGMLTDQQQAQGGQQGGDAGGAMGGGAAAGRPGGGLGTPEGTPDPIHKYRWAILAGCLALLAAGGGWVATRHQPDATPAPPTPAATAKRAVHPKPKAANVSPLAAAPQAATAPQIAVQPSAPTMLLEGLKEELFQLEVERQQGRVSDAEYQSSKSALDKTLQRALARAKGTAKS
jgi:hypothetical protein